MTDPVQAFDAEIDSEKVDDIKTVTDGLVTAVDAHDQAQASLVAAQTKAARQQAHLDGALAAIAEAEAVIPQTATRVDQAQAAVDAMTDVRGGG